MAKSRIKTISAFLGPWYVKVAAAIPAFLGTYDIFCNQFGAPKVPELWGMTGSLLPWWGWLLILQAVFVYALFEYVRRNTASPPSGPDNEYVDELFGVQNEINDGIATRLEKLDQDTKRIGNVDRDLRNLTDSLSDKIDNVGLMAMQNGKDHAEAMKAVAARIDAADAAAQGARDYAEGTNVAVSEAQAEALKEQRAFQARMETWVGNLQRKIRYGLVSADNAFAAILDREKMQELAVKIELVRDELSGPTEKKEPLGDRNAWLAKYGGWYRNLEAWARLGERHRPGTIKRVFATTDSDYEGKWEATDDLFASSIDVQKYKTFRIYSRNFFAEREAVERCVEQAAFVHPSQRPQPVLDEEEDDDQPYIPPPPPQV